MTGRIDLDVAHPRGESEKQLGDGLIGEVFSDQTKRLLHWKYDSKWGKTGDPANPNITKIYESGSDGSKLRDSCLELRRCARRCLKPMELVYKNPASKTETLVAIIETIPVKDPSTNTTNTIIYSPEQSFSGQVPTSGKNKAVTNNGILSTLYPRAIIKKKRTNYYEYFVDIETIESEAIDDNGRSMEASATNVSSPICYATEVVPGPTGPLTVIRKNGVSPSTAAAASFKVHSKDKSLSMTIAKGIDPCLIVCIASDMMNRNFIANSNGRQEDCLANCCFCCFC